MTEISAIEDSEKSLGQTDQFIIWTIEAMNRTSAQPQVRLGLLRSNFLEIHALLTSLSINPPPATHPFAASI